MLNIHDSEILSYQVDLKNRKILIQVERKDSSALVSVVFEGVMAHCFETQLNGSILFGIEKCGIEHFVYENQSLLQKYKDYCWPIDYSTLEELEEYILKGQYSYYHISSSYGLSGWVLSKQYSLFEI